MKISEIVANIYLYSATIRIKRENLCAMAKTVIFADGMPQAKALLTSAYGEGSVISINRIFESELIEAAKHFIKPRIVPGIYKHDLLRKKLLQQVKLDAMRVMPTTADIDAARNEFETQQKRMGLEYAKAVKDKQKWAEIRKCRLRDSK